MILTNVRSNKTIPKFRYAIVVWLLIGGIINYIDRATLSIAAPEIVKEFGFSMTELGLMGAAFSWCYAISQIPTGWISDKINIRIIFSVALIGWSFATMMTGFATTLLFIVICRGLLGIFEAPAWPAATKIISFWFPRNERGIAIGIFTSAAKWGPTIAPPILVSIIIHFDWRSIFFITGFLGIVFGILFFIFYQNPDQHKKLTSTEFEYIKSGDGGHEYLLSTQKNNITWKSLFYHRSLWGLILGYFCTIWIWDTFIIFLPMYLHTQYSLSLQEIGVYASLPWIGGAFGSICSGFIARWIANLFNLSILKTNQYLIVLYALLSAIALLFISYLNSFSVVLVLVTFTLIFISAICSSAWVIASEIAPPQMVSSVSSIQNFGGYFGAAFSPLITGIIIDNTGSYSYAFLCAAVVAIGIAISYLFIVTNKIDAPRSYTRYETQPPD